MIESLKAFDNFLFYLINTHGRNSFMDITLPILTDFGYFKIPVTILCLIVFIKGSSQCRKNVILVIIAVFIGDFISSRAVKNLFQRTRPCHVIQNIRLLGKCSDSFSFTSSHSTNMAVLAFTLSHYYSKWKFPLWSLALTICYSRVYIGVHYPSDCVFGTVLGILVSLFSIKYLHPLIEKAYPTGKFPSREEKLKIKK